MTAPHDDARWTGERVWLDRAEYDVPLRREIGKLLKPIVPDTLMAFNYEGDRVWIQLSDKADTRAFINEVRAALGRPPV